MSTRYQAQLRNTTLETLEAIRRKLDLEESDKAGLLDAIARIASWSVEQAARGRRIVATQDSGEGQGEENIDPILQQLQRRAHPEKVEEIVLTEAEASRLEALMRAPFEPNSRFVASLQRALQAEGSGPDLRWGE
jgi:hypothetical protein